MLCHCTGLKRWHTNGNRQLCYFGSWMFPHLILLVIKENHFIFKQREVINSIFLNKLVVAILPHSFLGSSDRSLQSFTESHTLELSIHSPFLHRNLRGPSHFVAGTGKNQKQITIHTRHFMKLYFICILIQSLVHQQVWSQIKYFQSLNYWRLIWNQTQQIFILCST